MGMSQVVVGSSSHSNFLVAGWAVEWNLLGPLLLVLLSSVSCTCFAGSETKSLPGEKNNNKGIYLEGLLLF